MIKNAESISMAEAIEYVKKNENSESDIKGFIKKFTKLSQKEAKELRKSLEKLELMKLKTENISKIIDIIPENAEDFVVVAWREARQHLEK